MTSIDALELRLSQVAAYVLLFATSGAANATQVGDWEYSSTSYWAATSNDSGSVFGQWCNIEDRNCVYQVAFATRCREDEAYAVLINSDGGTVPTRLVCKGKMKDRDVYRYAFENFQAIDDLVKQAQRMGIAIALQGDEFRVIRFSLRGATAAVSAMRSAAESSSAPRDTRYIRDQRL